MFRPLGSFTPTAVLTDICLFFDNDQFYKFSLASPMANTVLTSYRMMDYTKIGITDCMNKLSIELQHSNSEDTEREIEIDRNQEDITEKMAILLRTCRSINSFRWYCYPMDDPNWEYCIINEQLMELMQKIEMKIIYLSYCSISAPLPLFLKFLHRHGGNLLLRAVRLPSELVSNTTLKLIIKAAIYPILDSDIVVDVTDELLEGANTRFKINGFITKFTVKGISAFLKKHGYRCNNKFGIHAFTQLQDGINFERDHPQGRHSICLKSMNGQKRLRFSVFFEDGMNCHDASFSINLMTEIDQHGMVSIPNNTVGIVAQEAFVKFDKICNNPEEILPISQYQMRTLRINYCIDLHISYNIPGENRKEHSNAKSGVTLMDAQKIIAAILGNCISIEELALYEIKLDEEFYNLLKPIAHNIDVTTEWSIESALEPESLREVQAANTGLFGKVKLQFPTRT